MVATVEVVDLRRAAELRHHDDQRVLEPPALGQVVEQGRKRLVELTDLLQVEVEIFVVGVVVGVRHLHERDARFQQPAGEQAMAAEVVGAVAVQVASAAPS